MRLNLIITIGMTLACFTAIAQQNISDSLEHQGYQRKYIVHIPPTYSNGSSTPLVLTLHGGSGNYLSVQGFTEMNFVSNQNDFLSVYPQGYAKALYGGYTWADGRGTSADNANIDDLGFISKLIDTLAVDYNIDMNKIYVCGFSNGGFMTQRLACEIPERFAAVGGLGCSMDTNLIQSCNPSKPVPMAYFSGTADPEVPYNGGSMSNPLVTPIVSVDTAVQFWVNNNNCQNAEPVVNIPDSIPEDSSTVELYKYTDCDFYADFYFYKIINGGHTWPGVPVPQYPQLGNTNEDIHASYLLWDFFNAHTLCNDLTGLNEQKENIYLKVYPNPANNILRIESSHKIISVSVYNFMGSKLIENKSKEVNLQTLSSGIYLLNVEFMNNGTKTIKVVKE